MTPADRSTRGASGRSALEATRQQALADLAEVAAQHRDGELDDATAARLRTRYEADLTTASEALTALDQADDPAGDAAAPSEDRAPDGLETEDGTDGKTEGSPTRRGRRVAFGVGAIVVVLAAVAGLAHAALKPRSPGGSATGGISSDVAAARNSTDTTRDLSTVSNEEMEQVISDNPDVVPMRLALVERYLRDGDPTNARRHAQESADRATTDTDRAQALRDLGWCDALLGEPEQGATELEQSLALEADNPDALWFLAIVRYRGLARPADAVPLLQALLAQDIPDTQRQLVDDKLDEVQRVIADPSAASTTTVATTPGPAP